MPTENRSSNTEMVSVPPYIGQEPLVGRYYPAQCRRCGWVGSSEELTEDDTQCTRDVGDRLCLGDCDELERHDLLNIIQAMATPQPHPEPIAWMVGTAFWWTKEEAERDAAATGLPIVGLGPMTESGAPAIPDGYCLMPRRLTAENGAKALLLGEFKLEVTRGCPECLELDDPAEGCEICDGEGEFAQRHTIPWDQIKFIYREAVKGLALEPEVAR
ncbi:hypothetical protein [Pseudomonas putida]|uniref:hypothetical protein n=1 Tax=Pseudomonas putida TaxID=303 RepID=UPI00034F05BA|nr:hypothetical protein [Pseudomonas putida]AGN82960.1 hypothetical protein L483_21090 [Pseudomonas putida H8234]HDS1813703.1 hypothetical protein [Pseudomonas putida]HDS3809960.1 hypothetical protein [Pseudomonas putida]